MIPCDVKIEIERQANFKERHCPGVMQTIGDNYVKYQSFIVVRYGDLPDFSAEDRKFLSQNENENEFVFKSTPEFFEDVKIVYGSMLPNFVGVKHRESTRYYNNKKAIFNKIEDTEDNNGCFLCKIELF